MGETTLARPQARGPQQAAHTGPFWTVTLVLWSVSKTQSGLLRVPDTRGSLLGCRHIRDRLGVHSWPQAVFVLRTSGLQKHLS